MLQQKQHGKLEPIPQFITFSSTHCGFYSIQHQHMRGEFTNNNQGESMGIKLNQSLSEWMCALERFVRFDR